jgi:putative membrane protein
MRQAVHMSDVGNPRDHLANERTHLAWVRTALTVIVLGLAIARFGDDGTVSVGSALAGSVLLVAGTGVVVYGSLRYRATARELTAGTFTTARSTVGPVVAAAVLTGAMLVALVVLLVSDL